MTFFIFLEKIKSANTFNLGKFEFLGYGKELKKELKKKKKKVNLGKFEFLGYGKELKKELKKKKKKVSTYGIGDKGKIKGFRHV